MTREELDQKIEGALADPQKRSFLMERLEMVEKARAFATKAHGDQKYGDEPYMVHPEEAEGVLIEFDWISSMLRASILLHDVIEDTDVTFEDLRAEFPAMVAVLVDGVTTEKADPITKKPYKNRKERNAATYPKIRKFLYQIVLKLADRITNVRRAIRQYPNRDGLYQMYKKEYPEFRAALWSSNEQVAPMWAELDRLLEWQAQ